MTTATRCVMNLIIIVGFILHMTSAGMTIHSLVKNYGFKINVYPVKTEDGVTIELHHLCPLKGCPKSSKGVVFLQHSLLTASPVWVIESDKRSLGYLLAKAGYDVWMGNVRGNQYGMKNLTNYSFTLYHHSVYDLSSQIDTVCRETKQNSIFYACFSQGCSQLYMLTALKPEYNEKITAFAGLAGPRTMRYMTDYFIGAVIEYGNFLQMFGLQTLILKHNQMFSGIVNFFCVSIISKACQFLMTTFTNTGSAYIDQSMMTTYAAFTPQATSAANAKYFKNMKSMKQNEVRTFDYGHPAINLHHYKQANITLVNEKNIKLRGNIYSSTGDEVAPPNEVADIQTALVNSCLVRVEKKDMGFTHMNFILNSKGNALDHNFHIVNFFDSCVENPDSCTIATCPQQRVVSDKIEKPSVAPTTTSSTLQKLETLIDDLNKNNILVK